MTNREEPKEPSAAASWIDATLDFIAGICRVVTGFSLVFLTVIFGWLVYGRYLFSPG
jgi:TRAP-type C4-dicarboxylate transport system permease small subunit